MFYLFGLLLVATVLTRFLALGEKPIHFDESINGWFVLQMRTAGFYRYDPQNYHGPLFFYLLKIWTDLFGHRMEYVRILTSLFSMASVLFFWKRSPWTSFLLLISGSMIFYGRSAIHESAFVLGQIFFFVGLYEYQLRQRLLSLWWVLLGLAMMMTLKETFLFTGFAAVVAILLTFPWKNFFRDVFGPMRVPLAFFVLSLLVVFAGFGKNPEGILNFFRAFTYWFKTGVESGHNKPFWYWTELAYKAEPALLLAGVAAVAGLFQRRLRTLSIFALITWLIYSAVPYKTPWCMITWAWPLYFILGETLSEVWQKRKWRVPVFVVCAAMAFLNLQAAWPAIYSHPLDLKQPFIYVNSTYQYKNLDEALQKVLREKPELRGEVIQMSLDEAWPMPWTLQDSHELHYDKIRDRIFPNALAYFCEVPDGFLLDKELDNQKGQRYVKRTMTLRQFGREVDIYLRADIFSEFP